MNLQIVDTTPRPAASSPGGRPRRADRWLPPQLRKLLLTVHVTVLVGWLGIEAGLVALSLAGLSTRDPEIVRAAYVAMGLLGASFLTPLSIGALLSGVGLSLGTHWGLVRHYWVLAKLVMTVALTVGGTLVVNRRLQEAAARVLEVPAATLAAADLGPPRFQILGAAVAGLLLLTAATVLSVYKPWGMTRFARIHVWPPR